MNIKLYNNDCIEILKNIPDNSIDLIVTDPPYKVISGGKPKHKGQPSGMLSKNDGKIFEFNNINFDEWIPEAYRVLKNGSQCYIMTNVLNMELCLRICREVGFGLHNILVWLKQNCTPNRWYMKNCEYILFLRKGSAKPINNKGSQTVHRFNNIIGHKLHETEKPVELMKYYIENSSSVGDTVLDMFMGSGSTGVAAKELGRNFIGIEIDKKYFDIANERLSK